MRGIEHACLSWQRAQRACGCPRCARLPQQGALLLPSTTRRPCQQPGAPLPRMAILVLVSACKDTKEENKGLYIIREVKTMIGFSVVAPSAGECRSCSCKPQNVCAQQKGFVAHGLPCACRRGEKALD